MTGAILQQGALRGKFSAARTLSGVLRAGRTLAGRLSLPVGYADYTGDYDVRPAVHAQTLPTADRRLREDVTVQAIPYFAVDNAHGGETIIIGGEMG